MTPTKAPQARRFRLPVVDDTFLDDIRIATPCDQSWEGMKIVRADARVRHCDACKLNVYDISGMTRAESAALIVRSEGRVCIRMWRRDDGKLLSQDCWTRLRAARKRGLWAFACTLVLVAGAQLWLQLQGIAVIGRSLGFGTSHRDPVGIMGALEAPAPLVAGPRIEMGEAVAIPAPAPRPIMGDLAVPEAAPAPEVAQVVKGRRRMMGRVAHKMGKIAR